MSETKKTKKTITQCAKCNRAVYTSDVNAAGMCCNCESPSPDKKTVSLPEMADHPHPAIRRGRKR